MKPDYKNWIPKGMLVSLIAGTVLSLALLLVFGIFGIGVSGKLRIALGVVFGIAFVVCAKYTEWCVYAYRSFSYDGERKLSKQIIEGTAHYVTLPEGGIGLDVGCGSGALTIACAKRNPQGKMVGIDRWGKEYASFSLPLCEKNAAAEGVKNASFRRGNAVKLDFPDESFDAVTSNYVYHNITGKDKQQLLLETLRVLKKGGILLNFDADYASNVRNQNTSASHISDTEVYGHCGVTPELEQENASITLSMPMSRKQRPYWDQEFLENIGFSRSGYDLSVGQNILKEHDLKDAPMFLVWGVR